jgi:hypothetical protein
MWRGLVVLGTAAGVVSGSAVAQPRVEQTPAGLEARLARVGGRVAEFYARARTVTARETVRVQPLERDHSPVGWARQLVFELRVAWEPPLDGGAPPDASVLRHLLTVNGRPPRPRDKPECMDPQAVSSDALAMLLPHNRPQYVFASAGSARTDRRDTLMIDYKSVSSEPPEIVWRDECVSVSLPGRTRGRLWVDAQTDDVLRLDEHLIGLFEFPVPHDRARTTGLRFMAIERADSSIRYRPVDFTDPDETLLLPSSIERLTVWRNAAVNRVRMTQVFSDYRRFVTEGRVLDGR